MTNEITVEEAVEILTYERDNDIFVTTEHRARIHQAQTMAIQALESQQWIPKNPTNGDMIISLYPNLKYYVKGDRVMTTIGVASSFDLDWWNAPYREGDAE